MSNIPALIQHENEYILDEKRKIVLNARSLDSFQSNIYLRNFYTNMRPDLNSYDFHAWRNKLNLGEKFLNETRRRLNIETQRFHLQHTSHSRFNKGLLEENMYDLSVPHIQGLKFTSTRNWEDSNKLVAYVDKIFRRLDKYALSYPGFQKYAPNPEVIEQKVTDLFVREMRKPPMKAQVEAN